MAKWMACHIQLVLEFYLVTQDTQNQVQQLKVENNDLSAVSVGLTVTMGNMTVGVHGYDNGDSFGASTDTDKAKDSGYNTAITWAMGNITLV